MPGIYDSSGAYRVTVTAASGSPAGSYAPDGSYRVVISNQATFVPIQPAIRSGLWFNPVPGTTALGSAPTANTVRLTPVYITQAMTIQALGCRVGTADATGGVLAGLALYASASNAGSTPAGFIDPTGTPVAQVTGLSVAAAANVSAALAQNVTLQPGVYYMAVLTSSATAAFVSVGTTLNYGIYLVGAPSLGAAIPSNTVQSWGRSYSSGVTYPTWPDLTGLSMTSTTSNLFCITLLQMA